jgi:copper chaperone
MIEFRVSDMTCSHCVRTVTEAVKEVEPGAQVFVDLEAKRVRVDGAQGAKKLEGAIREAGYTPELLGE